MHVCVTFLPISERVELQNIGRTARQGKKGTGQLIIFNQKRRSIEQLKEQRTGKENRIIKKANDDIKKIAEKQKMFQKYCETVNKIIPLGR